MRKMPLMNDELLEFSLVSPCGNHSLVPSTDTFPVHGEHARAGGYRAEARSTVHMLEPRVPLAACVKW